MQSGVRILLSLLIVFVILLSLIVLAYGLVRMRSLNAGHGTRLTMSLMTDSSSTEMHSAVEQTTRILRARLDDLGATSAEVVNDRRDVYSIDVLLPPVQDADRVKNVLCANARLELRLIAHASDVPYRTRELAAAALATLGAISESYDLLAYKETAISRQGDEAASWVIVEKTPVITGADFRDARASQSNAGGENYDIMFSLAPAAADRFAEATRTHIGDHIAIVVQSEVRSAPMLQNEIRDRGIISGSFSRRAAEDLALVLRSGAYPGRLVLVAEETISTDRWTRPYKQAATVSAVIVIALIAVLYFINRRRVVL